MSDKNWDWDDIAAVISVLFLLAILVRGTGWF